MTKFEGGLLDRGWVIFNFKSRWDILRKQVNNHGWSHNRGDPLEFRRRHYNAIGCLRCTVGRTSVLSRRTFPVLRSTCGWRVAIYVGKPSAAGQRTRPTQPFILPGWIKWVVSNFVGCALVLPWWVLTRLSQVRFTNRWAPFVACNSAA